MKILWASNAPWAPSGYGTQTLQAVRRIAADGHSIAIAANYGSQAQATYWPGLPDVPILPALYDGIGNDILPAHFQAWTGDEPGVLITLYDVWPYHIERFRNMNVASWVPIDHMPAPPQVVAWCKEHRPLAMSRFGQRMLEVEGITADYIPHAIETSIYSPGSKAQARAELEWPADDFIILVNAANKGMTPMRKAWSENLIAASMFLKDHPDARIHLHTERVGAQSPDLQLLADIAHIDPARLSWTPQYLLKVGQISASDVARMYRASDVLLATSKGEGFGVPTVEAQACGLPVIVSDFSAQPELVGAGWLVAGQPDMDPIQSASFFTPYIYSIRDALEQAYNAKDDPGIRDRAIAKAQEYDADRVYAEHWRPVLASLEEAMRPPVRKGMSKGAKRRNQKAAA